MNLRTASLPLAFLAAIAGSSVANAAPCGAPPVRSYYLPSPPPAVPLSYSPGVQRMPTVSPPSFWSTYPQTYSWSYAPTYNWSWGYATPYIPQYYSYPTYSYGGYYSTYRYGPYPWYRIR